MDPSVLNVESLYRRLPHRPQQGVDLSVPLRRGRRVRSPSHNLQLEHVHLEPPLEGVGPLQGHGEQPTDQLKHPARGQNRRLGLLRF